MIYLGMLLSLLLVMFGFPITPAQAATQKLPAEPDTQQAYTKASITEANDLLGNSMALSGDTLAVSASLAGCRRERKNRMVVQRNGHEKSINSSKSKLNPLKPVVQVAQSKILQRSSGWVMMLQKSSIAAFCLSIPVMFLIRQASLV